jgi:PAS domain S-box-containing protein
MKTEPLDRSAFASNKDVAEFAVAILDAATEYSMIGADLDGTITLWNEGASRLYGYSAKEVMGQSITVLLEDGDLAAGLPDKVLAEAFSEGKWEGDVPRRRKDGTLFTAKVVCTPRRRDDGSPAGVLFMSSDITEHIRLRGERELADAKFRNLLEAAPDAMVIVNHDGEIELANAQTKRMFGFEHQELIGCPIETLIPSHRDAPQPGGEFPPDASLNPLETENGILVTATIREITERKSAEGKLELWGLRKDGTEFPIEISLTPLETEEGILATAAIRDVTDRKRFELQLKETNTQLAAADEAKDRFLASMSHELRTPLNAILGFTGTILMELAGPLTADQRNGLDTVQANGKHLLSIINDLLDLAKIESGKVEVHMEPVGCDDLLEEIVSGLRPFAREKGIELQLATPREEAVVRSDRRALSQILINLVNNAIKFTDEGKVRLKLDREGRNGSAVTRFSVEDTGAGIKSEDQEKLFGAFEQPRSRRTRAEGTGLGLYISQKLATLIGGQISFESVPGEGSTFVLELRG